MNAHYELPNPIIARIVGVSFDGRQEVVAKLKVGEEVLLIRQPDNAFDQNAIAAINQQGQQLGYLSRDLAEMISDTFDQYGLPILARVENIVGGYSEWARLGVCIRFQLPESNEGELL